MKTPEMNLSNQLCFSIYEANRLFAKFYQQSLKPYGLTYTQYLVLLALWEVRKANLNELTQKVHLASNTLTPLLKKLEKGGWVTRTRSEYDKRQLSIALTQEGMLLQPKIETVLTNCIQNIGAVDIDYYQQTLKDTQQIIAELQQVVD